MSTTNFVNNITPINADWLNDVNGATYNGSGVYTPAGTGAVPSTVQTKLRESVSVKDFGAKGDGITDDTAAIQAAINYVQNGVGGKIIIPNGIYKITSTLTLGNSSSGIGHNTLAPVSLEGVGPVAGVGYANPSNCAIIQSAVAGPAITLLGCLGWELKRLAFTFTTSSINALAFSIYEAQSGVAEDITILNCPGLVSVDLESWGNNNCTLNRFTNLFIFMNASTANAIGLKLSGTGTGGDVALNSFEGLHIQPGAASHIGLYLGYCDTNTFVRYDFNPLPGFLPATAAVKFDYSVNTLFPNNNQFFAGSVYTSPIISNGTPSFTLAISNIWSGFDTGNTAPVPSALGFAIEKMRLSGATTFYVASTGSASSFGIYSGNPCLSIQQAYDQLVKYYDLNGYTVTINIANATYTSGLTASTPISGQGGPSSIVINGGGGGTIFNPASSHCFRANTGCAFTIQSVNLTNSGTATSLVIADKGSINVGTGVIFGGSTASHKQVINCGVISDTASHFINGNATIAHYDSRSGGVIVANSQTITLLASITDTEFAFTKGGTISTTGMTFTLGAFTVTGLRYSATINGVIDTNGGGANYFPGTVVGTTATGGQYA